MQKAGFLTTRLICISDGVLVFISDEMSAKPSLSSFTERALYVSIKDNSIKRLYLSVFYTVFNLLYGNGIIVPRELTFQIFLINCIIADN